MSNPEYISKNDERPHFPFEKFANEYIQKLRYDDLSTAIHCFNQLAREMSSSGLTAETLVARAELMEQYTDTASCLTQKNPAFSVFKPAKTYWEIQTKQIADQAIWQGICSETPASKSLIKYSTNVRLDPCKNQLCLIQYVRSNPQYGYAPDSKIAQELQIEPGRNFIVHHFGKLNTR